MSNIIMKLGYKLYVNTSFGPRLFKHELKRANDQFNGGSHSTMKVLEYGTVSVAIIPYSANNYGFILWQKNQFGCILIDPGFLLPFQEYLVKFNLIPKMVLITHKHHDHTNGLSSLIDLYPNIEVIGSTADRTRFTTRFIKNSKETFLFQFNLKEFEFEHGIQISALLTPGHTEGHIIYSVTIREPAIIPESNEINHTLYFTGDTIFLGSIGRMFECKPSVYYNSVQFFIESLLEQNCPLENIFLYPAHEYGVVNLKFICETLNPSNSNAISKLAWCKMKRELNEPTIPTSIKDEFSYNPFLEIVIADNYTLQSLLNEKFRQDLNFSNFETLLMAYSLSTSDKKMILDDKCLSISSVKLFKVVRKMRDCVNFKD